MKRTKAKVDFVNSSGFTLQADLEARNARAEHDTKRMGAPIQCLNKLAASDKYKSE